MFLIVPSVNCTLIQQNELVQLMQSVVYTSDMANASTLDNSIESVFLLLLRKISDEHSRNAVIKNKYFFISKPIIINFLIISRNRLELHMVYAIPVKCHLQKKQQYHMFHCLEKEHRRL